MPSPFDGLGDDNPLSVQADETAARRLDTGFATEVRGLVHDPATGLAGRDPEAALAGIPETIPLLAELKDRYLAQATGPRQKALLEPLIDHRLDRAGVNLGRIVHQATSVLDDRSVANRIADLQQDASLSWQDKAHLRLLGRTVVNELRYQGERKGWDAGQTDTAVRTGLSDLYAGAVEAAIVQDPERAATLYDHARVVIQPDRQAAVERKIQRANEERRVTEIVGGLADMPDDPTRRPNLDDYQARAAKATPADASPEVRAQVSRMAGIEHARADQAWQATRGRAATGALDWLAANPGAPLMAMPTALRDGLSPEQTEALDRTAMNGGRVITDRDLYDRLDDQSVRDPESFVGVDLTQHRLSLGDSDYNRLTKLQKTLTEGKSDPAFERHRLGRLFLDEGLRAANLDPNGEEARTARQRFDTLIGAFEPIEGKPPTMVDIRGLVDDVLPRVNEDPNIVRTSGGEPAEANGNTEIVPQQEPDNAEANGLPAEESGEILPASEAQAEVAQLPESASPPEDTSSTDSIDSWHQAEAADGNPVFSNTRMVDHGSYDQSLRPGSDANVGEISMANRVDANLPVPTGSFERSGDEYDGLLADLNGLRIGPAKDPSEGTEKNSDVHLAQAGNTVTPRGFTVERAPIELDPHKLNKPIPGAEQQRIANVLGKLANADFSDLTPHNYRNDPHPLTGAVLPPSLNGYVTFDVPAPGLGRGVLRVIVERKTTAIYYTNNHYKSFYPVRLNPR